MSKGLTLSRKANQRIIFDDGYGEVAALRVVSICFDTREVEIEISAVGMEPCVVRRQLGGHPTTVRLLASQGEWDLTFKLAKVGSLVARIAILAPRFVKILRPEVERVF